MKANSDTRLKCQYCDIDLENCTCEAHLHDLGEAIFWDCPCPRCSEYTIKQLEKELGKRK